jgi:glycosyltransferase involved in cell wall biosynthesis
VLFLSNLLLEKGPLVLVDALAQLAARGVDFAATLAGAPSRELGAAEMRDAIQRAGLAERVHYVGAVDETGKDALFRAHDVFVLPSAREAFPLVVIEAMAAGLPVVATRVGAIADLVEDGVSGMLVDRSELAGDHAGQRAADRPAQRAADRAVDRGIASAVADALERLLRDPVLRERMGRAGRARFLERFTAAHFERQLGDVLAEVAGA